MKENNHELLNNINKLHTTDLGRLRIKKNLSLQCADVVEWCKEKTQNPSANIVGKGKNWYVEIDDCILTVNIHSYTIITAHIIKNKQG